ncbi:MAG: hypothetical protein OQL16_07685 [Gammaproteobacteria bacterium]|nr:hypothetical protein [Gammaproteobacteria bacterium]
MELMIKAGGIYNIALVIFHLLFWRIFNWQEDLRSLTFLNRAIMPVLNISLTLVFVIFSYISLVHAGELLSTSLGHSLLVLMAIFWFARAVEQVVFFKLKHRASWAFLAFFLLGGVLYAVPAIHVLNSALK